MHVSLEFIGLVHTRGYQESVIFPAAKHWKAFRSATLDSCSECVPLQRGRRLGLIQFYLSPVAVLVKKQVCIFNMQARATARMG